MSPKTLSPNISIRLNTSSGLRRDSPAISRLTSPWTPRTETRCPSLRSVRGDLGHDRVVLLRVLVFAVEVGQDGDVHGLVPSSMPHRASATGMPPYASSSSWNRLGWNAAPARSPVGVAQAEQLAPAHGIAELIGGPGAVAPDFGLGAGALDRQVLHHVVHRFGGAHAPGVQAHVEHDADRPPEQVHQLEEAGLVVGVVARLLHELLAVERPPLDHHRRPHVPAHLGGRAPAR